MDKIAATVVRRHQGRSGADGGRADQRPHHLRRELPALPWRRAAAGSPGYPALAAGAWIWGGTLDDIQQTVTHGIRSADPDARQSAMPRFGADGMLKPAEIEAVADYVWATFYGHPTAGQDVSAGAKIFADNCAACHGDQGQGNREMGAPRLASQVHLYGDTADTIAAARSTLPRQGVMPNWGARLDPATHQGGDAVCPCAGRRRVGAGSVSRISKDERRLQLRAGGRGRPPVCQPCAGLSEDRARAWSAGSNGRS